MVILLVLMFMVPAGLMNAGTQENTAPQPAGSGAVDNEVNTVVIQPNATDGKDTFIWENPSFTKENYGESNFIAVGKEESYNRVRGLIDFPNIPQNGEIESAKLSLYCTHAVTNSDDPTALNLSAHLVTVPWTEGTGDFWASPAAYGSKNDTNWINRTDGVEWGAPGGDFLTTVESYVSVSQADSWYTLDITDAVNAWRNGTVPNYGLMLTGVSLNKSAYFYAWFASSDEADSSLRPQLTITYRAQIDPEVPPITTNEDTPVDADLSGMGHGTVEHISGAGDGKSLWPLYMSRQAARFQALYTSDEVGAEGNIVRIALNRTAMKATNVSNLRIYMAHTDLFSLTTDFDSNYNGYLTEVFHEKEYVLNSSDSDSWLYFDLNGNFTYDSEHNLLVEIRWNGTGGADIATSSRTTGGDTEAYALDDNADTAFNTIAQQPVIRFFVDAMDTDVMDNRTSTNVIPFCPHFTSSNEMRTQMLYNSTTIKERGRISEIGFLLSDTPPNWANMSQFSIRMAYSDNSSLGESFEANHIGAWTEVFSRDYFNASTDGNHGWLGIELDTPFEYDGTHNLVLDIRWSGGSRDQSNPGLGLGLGTRHASYNSRLSSDSYSAETGDADKVFYCAEFVFEDYEGFTWSAASSNTTLFTASVSDNMLHISPVENAYGNGTVELTLHNDAYSTTQSIPVTINPVNDAPVISGLSAITCTEDVNYTLDMSLYASDVDNSLSDLTFTTDSSYATVDDHNITFNYPEGITSESVNITVEDPGHLTATAELQVTVTQVNDPPQFTSFADALTCDATVPKTYTVSPVDEETADGNFTIFTSSSYATVSGDVITFLYPKGIGSQTVQIYLLDENMYGTQNNISYTLNVSIIDHPEVVNLSSSANHIKVTFDMDMDMASVESAFSMARNGSAVAGTFAWSDARTVTFTPSSAVNGTYDITVGTGAEATTGAAMLSVYSGNYTAPAGLDSDGDGMPDSWEIANGFNPMNSSDAATDADHDGLSNYLEYRDGTQPKNNDTDGDGIVDGFDAAPLTPNDNTGSGAHSASSAFDPMMILVIILLVIVVILAVMLAKKKPGAPAAQEPQPASPMEQAPPAPVEQPVEPAPAGPEAPETPVSYEEPSEPQTPAEGEPSVENSVQAEESETPGEVLDLTEF